MPQLDTSQVPSNARKSIGNTKNVIGVIEEGLSSEDFAPEGTILERQAATIARLRGLNGGVMPTNVGTQLTPEVVNRVQTFQGVNPLAMNAQTLQGLASGEITRDGYFVGNNANFTGYYLEDAAKYVIPC